MTVHRVLIKQGACRRWLSHFISHARLDGIPEFWVILVLGRHTTCIPTAKLGFITASADVELGQNRSSRKAALLIGHKRLIHKIQIVLAKNWQQGFILFSLDAVALTNYIIQLSFIHSTVWINITVEYGYVGKILNAKLPQGASLFADFENDGHVFTAHRVYDKHFDSRANICPDLRQVIFELLVRQVF